ncbi:MAG: molybdopterin-binding protein, partial [Rhodospirillales bacterium]
MSKIEGEREFLPVNIAVLTVSDSRTLGTDKSGQVLAERIEGAGHKVAARDIVKDEVPDIVAKLKGWIDDPSVDDVIATGG